MERHYEDPLEWGVMATASGHASTQSGILFDRWSCMCLSDAIAEADLPQPFSLIPALEQQLKFG